MFPPWFVSLFLSLPGWAGDCVHATRKMRLPYFFVFSLCLWIDPPSPFSFFVPHRLRQTRKTKLCPAPPSRRALRSRLMSSSSFFFFFFSLRSRGDAPTTRSISAVRQGALKIKCPAGSACSSALFRLPVASFFIFFFFLLLPIPWWPRGNC